jgi:acetyl-CoA acetyltransferase
MSGTRNSRVAVVGVGYSKIGRKTGQSTRDMTIQACQAALDDAGLTVEDIDGFSTMGGDAMGDAHMLGMQPLNWFVSSGGPAFVYPALMSIAAIAAGFCETAMTTRIISQQPSLQLGNSDRQFRPAGVSGDQQFLSPFGAGQPTQWAGLLAQRHMAQYGTTEEQFGTHVVAQRHHASLNNDALFRDELTIDDYLSSRYVSKPLHILDCDYPCDSGSAVIFTTEERARDLKQKAVFVDAYALSSISGMGFEVLEDMARTSPVHCAEQLWSRTDLTPEDVDVAGLYDGFSIIVFQWLEALGFCGEGEAGPFVAAGNTRLGGKLPVNTDGGACNVGRRHGANFCIEATRQLRGTSGPRQVDGAEVAVWTNAVGPFSGAVLMTSE